MGMIFQYSIGDAQRRHCRLQNVSSCHFQYSIGDAAPTATVSANSSGSFQYSIGDAVYNTRVVACPAYETAFNTPLEMQYRN